MSEEQSDAQRRAFTACHACNGTGFEHKPQLAVLGGVAETVVQHRRCRWCSDEHPGRLPGLTPPV